MHFYTLESQVIFNEMPVFLNSCFISKAYNFHVGLSSFRIDGGIELENEVFCHLKWL